MLSTLLGQHRISAKQVILNTWNELVPPYHTSIDVKASDVHSISAGYILFVGRDQTNSHSITVLVNSTQMIRYCNLHTLYVNAGQNITTGQKLGSAKNNTLKLEYCTKHQGNSKWPVRIFGLTFYKQNPHDILTGAVRLDDSMTTSTYVVDNNVERNELSDEERNEYSRSRGVADVEF